MLRVYIESNLTFVDENRKHVFAVIETVSNQRTADGKLRFAADHDETILLPIENILTLGDARRNFPRIYKTIGKGDGFNNKKCH